MATTKKREIVEIEVSKLKPHPDNEGIYGKDENVSDVVEQIAAFNNTIIQPLVVKKDDKDSYTIISGYRRWRAALELELPTVPCDVTSFNTPDEELAALVLYNDARVKTIEQRTREGMTLERTFMVDAYLKRIKNLKQNQSEMDGASMSDATPENTGLDGDTGTSGNPTEAKASDSKSKGKRAKNDEDKDKRLTRDKVAEAVKLPSGKTYERAKNVIKRVDELKAIGKGEDAKLLIKVMNKAPATADELLKVFDSLSDDVKEEIRTDKINASELIPDKKDDKKQSNPTSIAIATNDFKTIGNTIDSIKNAKSQFKTDKQKKKYREQIETHLASLQELLKSLDDDEETTGSADE